MTIRILSRVNSRTGLWYTLPVFLSLALLFVVGFDNGAILSTIASQAAPGTWLHEFFHDARHAVGFPCH